MNKKTFFSALAVSLMFLGGARGAEISYTGASGGDWAADANWSSGAYPTAADNAKLNNTANLSSDKSGSNMLAIRIGVAGTGVLNVQPGGSVKATASSSWDSHVGSSGGNGTLNQSGGTVDLNYLEIGRGATGVYNLTGGDCIISRGRSGHSLYLGTDDTLGVNGGSGILEISGGSLNTRTGVRLGSSNGSGTGTFSVLGSGASQIGIGSQGSIDGLWSQGAGSTLRVGIDLGGLTRIYIDDVDATDDQSVTFEAGALLDVDYYNGGYGGGTWTVLEVENGSITNNGLAFAPGVDTAIWSFAIDNSGANGKLTVTAQGDPAPPQPDVTLIVGDTRNQLLRYGMDYERLWYWYGSGLGDVPQWTVNDCNIDFIRTAVVGGYELEEAVGSGGQTNYNLSAYTQKVIPMMTAMQAANPNIKWFASPRPLNESYPNKKWNGSNVTWQPYPIWVTGATTPISGDYDFEPIKCAQYLIRYLRLMKHYGFKITYLDLTNEWQSNDVGSAPGARISQASARDMVEYMKDYIANPPAAGSDPADPTGFYAANYPQLEPGDMPLTIAPSSWNYSQGKSWISNLDSQRRRDAIDIAASHNTDKTGTAQEFADQVRTTLGDDTEIWETEQHGWKSTSSANEVTSFHYYLESIRAGFTGISGWLAIGTTSQGHCYLLNNGSTVTRNVKYYIFKKLSNTSNYGHAFDVNLPAEFKQTAAMVRNNVLTVWVINESVTDQSTLINIGSRVMGDPTIKATRWNESLPVEGVSEEIYATTNDYFVATVKAESVHCFEITLADDEDNFPCVQAENFSTSSGVTVQPCADEGGGAMVVFDSVDDEVGFDLDITKTFTHDIAFRVASASAHIQFDIYDGATFVASIDRVATGGDQNWTTLYRTLPLNGGPSNLRVVAAGGGWNLNWIKFDPQYVATQSTENLAEGEAATASNVYQNDPGYGADKAVDGNRGTRWATDTAPAWIEVTYDAPTTINGFSMYEYGNRTKAYEIQYSNDGWLTWDVAFVGGDPEDDVIYNFPAVTATSFAYYSVTTTGNPSIYEFKLHYDPSVVTGDPAATIAVENNAVWLDWTGSPSGTYALERSTDLMGDTFVPLETGIPGSAGGMTNAVAMPDEAAFYRIRLE